MIDIKQLRIEKKMTQNEFSVILGDVQQSFLSEVERGKKPLPNKWKEILGEKFGIDPDEITNSYGTKNDELENTNLKEENERLKKTVEHYQMLNEVLAKALKRFTDENEK